MARLLIIFLFFFVVHSNFAQVVINEIVASNTLGLTDFAGDTPDWIELYNPDSVAVNLQNWRIADGKNVWQFPPLELSANDYLVVYASDKDGIFDSEIHTNFKLSAAGETLTLSRPDGQVADQITYPALAANQSYGRTNGVLNWQILTSPTPGAANLSTTDSTVFQTQLSVEQTSGFYINNASINIDKNIPTSRIYYTLDGTAPTERDFLYQSSLSLADLTPPTDSLLYVPTGTAWQTPTGEFPRAVLLRARAFRNGKADSEIVTQIYFKTTNPHPLPVVHLTVAQADLLGDERGIYVAGKDENYWQRGRTWERTAQVDFFAQNGKLQLTQTCGLRLGGGKTRLNPQKTLRLHARSDYGMSHFVHPFWGDDYGDKFKKITLRTLDVSPWSQAAIMDDFAHAVMDGAVETDYVRRKFVVVYINGVYWGIHSMREHNNEDFLARKYDLDDDDVKQYSGGSFFDRTAEKYVALSEDLESMNLARPADYEAVAARIDVVALTDYIITNLAFANKDWPTNNLEWWSADTYDEKLRFIINDLDATMQVYNDDRLSLYFKLERDKLDKTHRKWATFFLEKLLENADYRRYFNQRFNELLRTTFAPARTIPIWQQLANELRPEMEQHIRRWHFPQRIEKWEQGIAGGERFLLWRNDFLQREVQTHFGDPLYVFPNPTTTITTVEFELWQAQEVQLRLVDWQGRIQWQQRLPLAAGAQQLPVEMANLASGVYVVEVITEQQNMRQTLVKF